MTNDNPDNLTERDEFVNDEDTQITVAPPAPNFDAAQPMPVQPVIPVAQVPGEVLGAYTQQPQVVYVAQPTTLQPNRSWGWIPAALVLLLVATIAGAFVGAELYKRSTYAEAMPYSPEDVSPAAKQDANENKSVKTAEQNSLTSKEATSSEAPKSPHLSSSSIGFAQKGKIESHNAKNSESSLNENDSEENTDNAQAETDENSENADLEKSDKAENKPNKEERKTLNPAEIKEQIKKVENKKDTENIVPPQRSLPNDF